MKYEPDLPALRQANQVRAMSENPPDVIPQARQIVGSVFVSVFLFLAFRFGRLKGGRDSCDMSNQGRRSRPAAGALFLLVQKKWAKKWRRRFARQQTRRGVPMLTVAGIRVTVLGLMAFAPTPLSASAGAASPGSGFGCYQGARH